MSHMAILNKNGTKVEHPGTLMVIFPCAIEGAHFCY